jgi:long-chain-fatty-acid--CoA ligase ACSBG
MLSHDNLTWSARGLCSLVSAENCTEVGISYLPLSHIAAQIVDIYGPISCAAAVYFAQPDALKGSLGATLKEVRPTTFLGVPRVWEKMQEAMTAIGKSSGMIKQMIASWAKGVGLESNIAAMNGGSKSFMFSLADMVVFSKVRAALGLDRCRLMASGAAPMSRETLEFFLSLNIPIMEVYGMSESTAIQAMAVPWCFRIGSVGREFPGVSTVINNPDEDGNGEILMDGRHVFMGYLNMDDVTQETIDEKGRLHSGDIGRIDEDGFMYVTGRIKELIITAGGENVPPVPIEDRLKAELPAVSNCMLIGDKRKFLSLLITLKTEINEDTQEPTEKLLPVVLNWCRSNDSPAMTVGDVQHDVALLKSIQAAIDRVNKSATSRAQCIQKWCILPRDFSVFGGELGPTLKLKRSVVEQLYHHTIDEFYAENVGD